MKIMLHRFLMQTGLFETKKNIIDAIEKGEIEIASLAVKNPKYQFNPNTRKVKWNNKILKYNKENYYVIFNKPIDYLSTKLSEKDIELGKKTIFDLFEKIPENIKNTLFAVGRLDENSSGLIILTSDGKLGFNITNPKKEIEKTYDVVLEKAISEYDTKKVESGLIIDLEINGKHFDYKTKPSKIKKISDKNLLITITEGKKREVRRIFESLNNKVLKLKRICIGKLRLDDLDIDEGNFVFVDKELILETILN